MTNRQVNSESRYETLQRFLPFRFPSLKSSNGYQISAYVDPSITTMRFPVTDLLTPTGMWQRLIMLNRPIFDKISSLEILVSVGRFNHDHWMRIEGSIFQRELAVVAQSAAYSKETICQRGMACPLLLLREVENITFVACCDRHKAALEEDCGIPLRQWYKDNAETFKVPRILFRVQSPQAPPILVKRMGISGADVELV